MAQDVTKNYYYAIGGTKTQFADKTSLEVGKSAVSGTVSFVLETVTPAETDGAAATSSETVLTATVTADTESNLVLSYKVDSTTTYALTIKEGARDGNKVSVVNAKSEYTLYIGGVAFTDLTKGGTATTGNLQTTGTSAAEYVSLSADVTKKDIKAQGGTDYIENAGNGNTIEGEAGNDTIISTAGEKVSILGGDGDDSIDNSGKEATLNGGAGADKINNAGEKAYIDGGNANDYIYNTGLSATILGGAGNDTIISNYQGTDTNASTIQGGDGSDLIMTYGAGVTIDPGAGNDTIGLLDVNETSTPDTKSGRTVIINSTSGTNLLQGYDANDSLVVNAAPTLATLSGNATNALLTVGTSKTTIEGGRTQNIVINNTAAGETYNFNYVGGAFVNSIAADENKTYTGTDIADYVDSAVESAEITTKDGNDTIISSGAGAEINAGDGANIIRNTGSNANITAGKGNDTVINAGAGAEINAGNGNNLFINAVTVASAAENLDDVDATTIKLGTGNDTIKSEFFADWVDHTDTIGGSEIKYETKNGTYTKTTTKIGDDGKLSTAAADITTESWTVNGESVTSGSVTGVLARKRIVEFGSDSGSTNTFVDYSEDDVIKIADGTSYSVSTVSGGVLITAGSAKLTLQGAQDKTIAVQQGDDTLYKKLIGSVFYNVMNDTVSGTADPDYITNSSTDGQTAVDAKDGSDIIVNYKAEAKITAGAGNDSIYNAGNKLEIDLSAGGNNLVEITNTDTANAVTITGGSGNDTIRNVGVFTFGSSYDTKTSVYSAVSGEDTISWKAGTDVVSTTTKAGAISSETLVHNRVINFSADGGKDYVADFKTGDVINITDGEATLSTVSGGVAVKVGSNAVITLGGAQSQDITMMTNGSNPTISRLSGNVFYNILDTVGTGTDAADSINVAAGSSVESIAAGAGNDIIENYKNGTSSAAFVIDGGSGNDTVRNAGSNVEIKFSEAGTVTGGNNTIELMNYSTADSAFNVDENSTSVGTGVTIGSGAGGNDTISNVWFFSNWVDGSTTVSGETTVSRKVAGNTYTEVIKNDSTTYTDTWVVSSDNVAYTRRSTANTVTDTKFYKLNHDRTINMNGSSGNDVLTDYGEGDTIFAGGGELSWDLVNNTNVKLTVNDTDNKKTGTLTLNGATSKVVKVVDGDNYERNLAYIGNQFVNLIDKANGEDTTTEYVGTATADSIVSHDDNAVINADSGNDTIRSSGAGAVIDAGAGNDLIEIKGMVAVDSDGEVAETATPGNVTVNLGEGATTVRSVFFFGDLSAEENAVAVNRNVYTVTGDDGNVTTYTLSNDGKTLTTGSGSNVTNYVKDHSRVFVIESVASAASAVIEDYNVGDTIQIGSQPDDDTAWKVSDNTVSAAVSGANMVLRYGVNVLVLNNASGMTVTVLDDTRKPPASLMPAVNVYTNPLTMLISTNLTLMFLGTIFH